MIQSKKSKRLTSRDIQAVERRQQILDIAMRLFAENGYHATSMRELNKEIGMADALTYHYFPGGKLEILKAVLQHAQEERMKSIVGFFAEVFVDDLSLSIVLLNIIQGITERIKKDQQYFQILIRERTSLDRVEKDALFELTKQPFVAMAAYLTKRFAQGHIREMDFTMASSQFLSHIVVLVVQQMMNERAMDQAEVERLVDFYIQLWSK
jgi:AcrR family transcriptional regulator